MELNVYTQTNQPVDKVELADEVFKQPVNYPLLQEVVTHQLACRRRGTASTKTKAEVSGGGRKPWRQKGTGRARAGTIRSPIWRHGGVCFGPHPRSYSYSLPKKKRKIALKSALLLKFQKGEVIILDKLKLTTPRTKAVAQILNQLGLKNKALLVIDRIDNNLRRAARNIPNLKLVGTAGINVFDLLNCNRLVLTKEVLNKIKEKFLTTD